MNQHFTFRELSCAPSSFNIYSICYIHIVGVMLRVGWIDDTFFLSFFIVEVVVLLSENSLLNSFVFHVQYSYMYKTVSEKKEKHNHDTVE